MPELPEVEVTRRSVQPHIEGATIRGVSLGKPLRWPLGCAPAQLIGRRVRVVHRRGKYLWFELDDGSGLLVHLGMSGSLRFGDLVGDLGVHDHFELQTTTGALRLTDPRRFGAVVWSPSLDAAPASTLLAHLGLEPFDERFNGAHLHRAWRQRRVSVKQALLAGDAVVGAGNIYACEALFRSGIDPRLSAQKLSLPRCSRLAQAVRSVLEQALSVGGSTLRDFRDAHGMAGAFQQLAGVYGREGLPCPRCGRPVARIVQGQRSTFFCRSCQKR